MPEADVRVPVTGIAISSTIGPVSTSVRDVVAIENEPSYRNVTLTEEHDDVRASRLRREEADAAERRSVARLKLYAYLGALFGTAAFCTYLALGAQTADVRDKAFTTLVALITGSFAYLAGEKAAHGRADKN